MSEPSILHVSGLSAGYGARSVVRDVDLAVGGGEVVALIGHNGAGKSTLLKAIYGAIPSQSGSIKWEGTEILRSSPLERKRRGITFAPQGNRVFEDLTGEENLRLAIENSFGGTPQSMSRLASEHRLDPQVMRRPGRSMSGGERQVLSLAMAMAGAPKLLLLDEPTLGLAPRRVGVGLDRIRSVAKVQGIAVLIVEQKVREVLRVADQVCVLRNGVVSFRGTPDSLSDDAKLREVFL